MQELPSRLDLSPLGYAFNWLGLLPMTGRKFKVLVCPPTVTLIYVLRQGVKHRAPPNRFVNTLREWCCVGTLKALGAELVCQKALKNDWDVMVSERCTQMLATGWFNH